MNENWHSSLLYHKENCVSYYRFIIYVVLKNFFLQFEHDIMRITVIVIGQILNLWHHVRVWCHTNASKQWKFLEHDFTVLCVFIMLANTHCLVWLGLCLWAPAFASIVLFIHHLYTWVEQRVKGRSAQFLNAMVGARTHDLLSTLTTVPLYHWHWLVEWLEIQTHGPLAH